jgi:RNA polymerase sigma-70 factor, ECF subfamily
LPTNDKETVRHPSDEILISWVARGDPAALETLYDRHAAIVLGVCLRLISNRTTAEHVLQEIFWQVWQQATTYQAWNGPFTSWLFRIVREVAQKSE